MGKDDGNGGGTGNGGAMVRIEGGESGARAE